MNRSRWIFLPYAISYFGLYVFYQSQRLEFLEITGALVGAIIVLSCLRSFLGFFYLKNSSYKPILFRLHAIVVILSAVCLGALLSAVVHLYDPSSKAGFISFLLVFMTLGGMSFSLSPWPTLRLVFTSLVFAPVLLALYQHQEKSFSSPLIFLSAVYWTYLEAQSRTYFREFAKLFQTIQEAHQDREKLSDVLDAVNGFVIYIDDDRNIVVASHATYDCLNLPREISQIPDSHPLLKEINHMIQYEKISHTKEVQYFDAWFMLNIKRVYNPVSGFVVYGSSIAELVAARKQIELQRQKTMQTARLSAVGELAGGISHEINNPLSVIIMCVKNIQMMLKLNPVDPEKINPILTKISDTSMRISKIIQSLRQFAKDTSGEPFIPTSLNEVIDVTLDFVREKFKNRGIELRYNRIDDVRVLGRKTDLSQALFNVIHNSVDAVTPLKDRWIQIDVAYDDEFAYLAILDSGPGLTQEVQDKLFVPFVTTKAVGAATGLGLSITKGILDQHQGDVYYDTTRNNTCFIFKIPLVESVAMQRPLTG